MLLVYSKTNGICFWEVYYAASGTEQGKHRGGIHPVIEDKGYAAFSMGELAKSLNVKTASLYNHVESLDALFTDVGLAAVSQMVVE
jgi:hypothetical protein